MNSNTTIVDNRDEMRTMPVSAYVLSMLSVGILFYVIFWL